MPIDIDSFVNELERRRAIPLDCDDCGQTVGQQAMMVVPGVSCSSVVKYVFSSEIFDFENHLRPKAR